MNWFICENADRCVVPVGLCARKVMHTKTISCGTPCSKAIRGSRCVPCDENGRTVKVPKRKPKTRFGKIDGWTYKKAKQTTGMTDAEMRDLLAIVIIKGLFEDNVAKFHDADLKEMAELISRTMEARKETTNGR